VDQPFKVRSSKKIQLYVFTEQIYGGNWDVFGETIRDEPITMVVYAVGKREKIVKENNYQLIE